MKSEPVLIAQAIVAIAAVFGLGLNVDESATVVAILAAAAAWVRSRVSPVA
jgi:hypothetical protein